MATCLGLVERGPDPVQRLGEDVQQREAHAGDGPCGFSLFRGGCGLVGMWR